MTYKERQKDVQEALFDHSQLGGKLKVIIIHPMIVLS